MDVTSQALWTAIFVVLLTVLARVTQLMQRRKRRLAAEATRAKMLPQMLERYDADRDGQLNATEYTLLLHDIGVNVHMTPDRWELERSLLGAPAAGVRTEHLAEGIGGLRIALAGFERGPPTAAHIRNLKLGFFTIKKALQGPFLWV